MNKLKITSIILSVILMAQGVAFAATYSDVNTGHKYYKAIESITEQGIVSGYPDGTFQPEGLINRAEAVKILVESNFSDEVIQAAENGPSRFPDVPTSEWFSKYVEVSYENNIVEGHPDGTFKPADNINFAEALKVILETYGVDFSENIYEPHVLIDVQEGEWFEKYFTYTLNNGLFWPTECLDPGQPITRGEFASIIYKLEKALEEDGVAFNLDLFIPSAHALSPAYPEISLNPTTPASAMLTPGQQDVPLFTFNIDAQNSIAIDSIKITRFGTEETDDSDWNDLYLKACHTKWPLKKMENSVAEFSSSFYVPVTINLPITLFGSLSPGASEAEHFFMITSAADIERNDFQDLVGDFPIAGNTFRVQ